mmetsp:Transcript_1595/g.4720  ORF Transcript_1595/g.4720 Transcript_1595/m.4720 type:complete len:106 (-) Transcript_1595:1153-1470(-)
MHQPAAQEPVEISVLKGSREACYKARDRFFACIQSSGLEYTSEVTVPSRCSRTRRAYEDACRNSWVHHFDLLKDKETKHYQRLALVKQLKEKAAAKAAAEGKSAE